jgi:transcriptional regulator with XRE-family HTH domain
MNNDDIAKKVKETRKMRGLTQSDIAKVLDKTPATVSDMERGKIQISAADLFKIANVLNCPVEYFFGDEYGNEEIQDLIFLIRKQPLESQGKIFEQVKMFLSLEAFQELVTGKEREISEEEVSKTISFIFQYADEIEKIHNQMSEIKINLREVFKSQGIKEEDVLDTKNKN